MNLNPNLFSARFKQLSFLILFSCFMSQAQAQDFRKWHLEENYDTLITFADNYQSLSNEDCYLVGHALYKLDNETKAIELFNHIIDKGYDSVKVYFYKGLSYRYLGEYETAKPWLRLAHHRNPESQRYLSGLAKCFQLNEELDSALILFKQARELPYEVGGPYFEIPAVLIDLEKPDEALVELYAGMEVINKEDFRYPKMLHLAGYLEYRLTHNYADAIKNLEEAAPLIPNNYDLKELLIKCYHQEGQFEQADKLMQVFEAAWVANELPDEYQEDAEVGIDRFESNGKEYIAFRVLEPATETIASVFKVYEMNEAGDDWTMLYLSERTLKLTDDGPEHLFCAWNRERRHFTFPIGWKDDELKYKSMKDYVVKASKGEISWGASSMGGSVTANDSGKKDKKKKKKRK